MTLQHFSLAPTLRTPLSEAEKLELSALGFLDERGALLPVPVPWAPARGACSVERKAISNVKVLNAAHAYHPTPMASAARLTPVLQPWRKSNRIAEIRVPA